MKIEAALYDLGVRPDTLDIYDRLFLDEYGYLPLPNLLTSKQVQAMRQRVEELVAEEAGRAGEEFRQEEGAIRLANLVNKDPLFEICFTQPLVLAAVSHVLNGDLKLSSLNGRMANPGAGLQNLHVDWREAVAPDNFQVCNSIWLLDDFTEENGATRVVPGSHRSGQLPQDAMDDPSQPHPDEVLLLGEAGTVVIFNSHTWHGGTFNSSGDYRRALHAYFVRRQHPQQTDQRQYVRAETAARLSNAAKCILDVL
ncbi:phytanoyl-CoA dioxygenase family protein [Chloroflexi bacterium TSY]|nr:phytanoyl-CoA dioxygenase family protein [Chloroflexi bacterium TSY]